MIDRYNYTSLNISSSSTYQQGAGPHVRHIRYFILLPGPRVPCSSPPPDVTNQSETAVARD